MRNRSVFAIAMLAVLSVRCSGGSAADTHQSPDAGPGGPGPNDQDYSSRFAGTWNGSATVTTNGHSQTAGVSQRIDNVGFNQLALLEMCRGAAGVAVIDSATSFSMDPRTCRPTDELHLPLAVLAVSTPACGATTVRYERGRGNLAQNVLTTTLEGNASGCGQTLPFKLTFTGTLASGVGTQSSVRLQSEPGDPVGFGGTYAYTKADAQISVRPTERGRLDISVDGDQTWLGFLQMPSGFSLILPGTYEVPRRSLSDPTRADFDWSGAAGGGCGSAPVGSVTVDGANYTISGSLMTVDLRFEQRCNISADPLHGQIHWDVNDTTVPGPIQPPPGLWAPLPGSTPATGSYVRLESDPGDFIGMGGTFTYTKANSSLSVSASTGLGGNPQLPQLPYGFLAVSIKGDDNWSGEFQTMIGVSQLQPGYYANLQQWPFHNLVRGGLDWSERFRGCSGVTGWFVVDGVTFSGSTLTRIDVRFEQHCKGSTAALHGQIHWDANDTTAPPGPVSPPPADLWDVVPGSTPTTGSFVYLESEPGDPIGQGKTFTYTKADSLLSVAAFVVLDVHDQPLDMRAVVSVTRDAESWTGVFAGMSSLSQLQPGYYPNLHHWDFNPVLGGLGWWAVDLRSSPLRSCGGLTGWFVIDQITFSGTTLANIDLRFEQRCDGETAALHGKIHWDANDPTTPPGPIPPPPGLWEPVPGSTPATGSYVHLESEPGDPIGGGQTFTFTKADAIFFVTASGGQFSVEVRTDEDWFGGFRTMSFLSQFQPGYYGNVERAGFQNPLHAGLAWSRLVGNGFFFCETLTGWFVVDAVTYDGASLAAIDFRFEQHCQDSAPALHGKVHWDSNDPTTLAGPIFPPPPDLWQPAPGSTPASGSYVYLESEPGDPIGAGGQYTYTKTDALLSLSGGVGGGVAVAVNAQAFGTDNFHWSGHFQAMSGLQLLQPGYYSNLKGFPSNPARGELVWFGDGRSCSAITGWFVVDSVTYFAGMPTLIDIRFEQICNGGVPALHGKIHWDASDPTRPPGPIFPPPPDLWEPVPGSTPATGNFVRLESEPDDPVGRGNDFTYGTADATFSIFTSVRPEGSLFQLIVSVSGDELWSGVFESMAGLSQLQPGYYGNLLLFGVQNVTRGGLFWLGPGGSSCNPLTGWVVVDSVKYFADNLIAIDLRFEQHCDGFTGALHGKIHWILT